MTDEELRGFDPAGHNSELIAMRSGPVEVVRYHNRAHVELSCPLSADQAVRLFETVAAIVRSDIRNDESRNALMWLLKTASPGSPQINKAIAQIYQDGMRIKALEAALKPFAKAGELFKGPAPAEFDQRIYDPAAGDEWAISGDDLRRARDILKETGNG